MTNAVTVRKATPADAQPLAELDAISWPVQVQVVPPRPSEEPFFTSWRKPGDVLVAEYPGHVTRLLGYLRLGRHMNIAANDHVLHIEAVVVSGAARGQGVGAALVDAGIAEARARGVAKLGLRALSNNPAALRLYERHGFVEEGRLRRELRRADGTYADDVWMALWLTEVTTLTT